MEIARTSLWGFYCRKGTSWTQITTDWEHLCGLKMIKSWRFHFSKQKRSAIGQAVWTLFSYYLVKKYIFWLNSVINNWAKSCLQSFIQSEPNDSVHAETYMNALNFFSCSLKYYSSPLYIQNKTFDTIFFSFGLFQGTAKPQNRGGKVEPK